MNKSNKHGQMEIIGLVMISVIAGLLLVFAMVYLSKLAERQEFAHEPFGERIVSTNFVTVMANTYVPDCSEEYSSLVKDCARGTTHITCLNSTNEIEHACSYAAKVADQTLQNSLDRWKLSYRFRVESPTGTIFEKTGYNCTTESEKEAPGRHIVPLYPSTDEAFIILEVCKT